MKKILSAILCLVLALSLNAQDARQRTVETIVADVLAALPTQNSTDFDTYISDLAAAAPASVIQLASMMKPAAEGVKNNLCEYALTGLSCYASANPAAADKIHEGFVKAIAATADKTNKEFLLTQFRPLAGIADKDMLSALAQDPAMATTALRTLVDIPGTEDGILALVNDGKIDKSLLADAAARKGLTAAEPVLQSWVATSTGRELQAICSSLASIGSESSLDILKDKSFPEYASLAVKLSENGKSKAVAKAAKALLSSEVSAYKSAGALAQMQTNPAKAIKTVSAALDGSDVKLRNSVLAQAGSIVGNDAVSALIFKKFPKLADAAKVDALNWLGNNKIASAASLVSGAVAAEGDVAKAAIAAAGKIGGDECLAAVISQLGGANSALAAAALKSYKGDIQDAAGAALDAKLAQIASGNVSETDRQSLWNICDLICSRRLTGLAPKAYSMIESSDSYISDLGEILLSGVVTDKDIDKVSALLDKATGSTSKSVLQEALHESISSLTKDAQSDRLISLMKNAKNPANYYAVLASTNTDNAVETLSDAFKASKDADAIKALTSVDNYKAAPVLLEIAKTVPEYSAPAVNAFTNLVSRYETNAANKCAKYAQALALAGNAGTIRNVLNNLGNLPTMKAFLLAGKYLDNKDVKMAAANAVKNIATATKEEIDYNALKTNLTKAAAIYTERGWADDEYAVKAIEKILAEAEPSPVSVLTPEEQKQGFEMLFDGTSLDKWEGNLDGYVPMNGTIYVSAGYGSDNNLYTKKEYRNFVYRFEFCMLREGVNNGVGIRTPEKVDAAYEGMCEVQILDHDAPMYANLKEYQVHGSVYGVVPAKRIVHKPLGEWSTEEIRVEGDHIKVTVNGEVIVDANVRKACKGHNVSKDGSSYNPYTVDHKNHPGMFNKTGHISFCGHGEGLKIRNVRILDLDK